MEGLGFLFLLKKLVIQILLADIFNKKIEKWIYPDSKLLNDIDISPRADGLICYTNDNITSVSLDIEISNKSY